MYYLYAIGKDIKEPYDQCYIGVTNNPLRRWENHKKSKYTVGEFIRTHELQFDKNFKILYTGSDEECFNLEEKYRPQPLMGLNESTGGKGGYTSYSEKRNKLISEKLKNRNMTWGNKVSKTRKEKSIAVGEKNPNAKTWIILDPSGNEYIITGKFNLFCEENNILASCLRYYRGKPVPPLSNTYGGYREKKPGTKKLRENTTNWILLNN
jgi:hypothetical protein